MESTTQNEGNNQEATTSIMIHQLLKEQKMYQEQIYQLGLQHKKATQKIKEIEQILSNICQHQWVKGCDGGIDEPREYVCSVCNIIR